MRLTVGKKRLAHYQNEEFDLGYDLIRLRKHGGSGGECSKWVLKENDYIREIQFTFQWGYGYVAEIAFKTHYGEIRTIGA